MILLTLAIGLILYLVIRRVFEIRDYPPGPYPLPFLGNALQLGYYVTKTGSLLGALKHFKEVYGPVFTVFFGPFPMVMIGDYELANEAMVKHGQIYADRWEIPTFAGVRNYHGLITSSGNYWVEQRRFALHTLRNLGVSRNIMQERIMEEWHARFGKVNPTKSFSVRETFDLFTGSIINRLLFSYRLDDKREAQFTSLKKEMDDMMESLSVVDTIIPGWARNFPIVKTRFDAIMKPLYDVKNFLADNLKERIAAIENGSHEIADEPNDFVDAFIIEMRKREKEDIQSSFSMETLICDTFDLYLAGQDTTSNTITWAICYLLNHPEVADKIRNELLEVTRGERDLLQTDKSTTPYFNATIHEIQRVASIITINFQRLAAEDLHVGGVLIKKGTPVTAQLCLIMSDEKYFPEPEKFKPERYLESGKAEYQPVAFGLGKRACLGESLARAELYLILGNLLQRYKFEAVGEIPQMKDISPMSPFKRPPKYQIRLIGL